MTHLFRTHLDAVKAACVDVLKQPIGFLLILLMLGIALTLPLSLYIGVKSAQHILGGIKASPQITVYMDLNADALDVAHIKKTLSEDSRITELTYVSKAEALNEMQGSLGEADLVSILDENPLPDVFVIDTHLVEPQDIEALQDDLNQLPMVEVAKLDAAWLKTLYAMEKWVRHVLWFLAITLALAFVLVANNTIRLQTLTHKEEIEIMRLLGAPASFIRRPFLYQSLIQGILALLIGFGLCAWMMKTALPQLAQVFEEYGFVVSWSFFSLVEVIVVVILVLSLAFVGAWWAIYQHLSDLKRQ